MPFSEIEYLEDPSLQKTRMYDKINPEIEGFVTYNRRKGRIDAATYQKMEAETKVISLDSEAVQQTC